MRMAFSNFDDDDNDDVDDDDDCNDGDKGAALNVDDGVEAKGEVISAPPASPSKGASSTVEIRRLSEAEDGEIMFEDEDGYHDHRPMVIPMEPEFTDDEDAMETAENDPRDNDMDVDVTVGRQNLTGCDRRDVDVSRESATNDRSCSDALAPNPWTAKKGRISPVRFP